MKMQALLIADYASVDTASGKLYVIGAFDRITAREFPAVHPRMAIILKLVGADFEAEDHHNTTVTLRDQDAGVLFQVAGPIPVNQGASGYRSQFQMVLELNAIVFPAPGIYEVVVEIDGQLIGSAPIELVKA